MHKPRKVRVDKLEMIDYRSPDADILVRCSKGTYIRSLARDIAQELGTFAYVSSLTRTMIGSFSRSEAVDLESLAALDFPSSVYNALTRNPDIAVAFPGSDFVANVRYGRPISSADLPDLNCGDGLLAIFTDDRSLAGILERCGEVVRYRMVSPHS